MRNRRAAGKTPNLGKGEGAAVAAVLELPPPPNPLPQGEGRLGTCLEHRIARCEVLERFDR
jgi:hypothetical protein